jgi:predicted nucleic acid-binding protein
VADGNFNESCGLWEWFDNGLLAVHDLSTSEVLRMRELMERYADVPMDFADASLVTTAETLNVRKIFTLDSDFRIYRTADGGTFDIVP